MKPCRIVGRPGPMWPEGRSRIYTARAGRKGRGRVLARCEGRGNLGELEALAVVREKAQRLGYEQVNVPVNVPLISVVGGSNELPPGEDLRALVDRFWFADRRWREWFDAHVDAGNVEPGDVEPGDVDVLKRVLWNVPE